MLNRLFRDGCQEIARIDQPKYEVGSPFLVAFARNEKIPGPRKLLADAELADYSLIALGIVFLEVVEQATPLADQHEKAAA